MESIVESPQVVDDFVMDCNDFGSEFPVEAGHFFDDPLMRGQTDIRSHLEDLAHRHPEFAEHLRYPAWSNDNCTNGGTWGRKRRGSGQSDLSEASKQQQSDQSSESKEETGPLRGRARENLRNTVPDMGQKQQQETDEKESRGQRSWSAPPPDNRTQENNKPRFVSKIEIHPVNPDAKLPQQTTSTGDATKPPMAPPKPQPQQPANQSPATPQHKTSTVRHIPIFVEGRDEPILPKVEQEFTQTQAPPQPHFVPPPSQSHQQFHPQRKQTPPRYEHPPPQPKYEQVPIQTRYEQQVPIPTRFEQTQQTPSQPQPQPPPPTQQDQQQPPVNPNDPLYRVECVQREVDLLKELIENFSGTSRKDKEYIILDEMLTRNLIKLDNIETEGKEEVRAARKNTIKSIQRYISILENKIPLPNGENKEVSQDNGENKGEEEVERKEEAMEVEQQQPSDNVVVNQQKDSCESRPNEALSKKLSSERPMEIEVPKKPQENMKLLGVDETFSKGEEKDGATVESKDEKKEQSLNEAVEKVA